MAPDTHRQQGAAITGKNYWSTHQGPGPRIMAADTLEGNDVINQANEKIGEIEHIMLDVPHGVIAYVVLGFGGFLGMGEKLFAIPWRALTLDTDKKCFRLDVSKEQMSKAESFDKDHWPTFADETWASNLHTYYKARPYWEEL